MILKYKDYDDNWNWIDEIRHFKKVSIASSNGNIVGTGSDPIYLELTFQNGDIASYELNVQEAYICNDSTGSTIDVIKSSTQ